MNNESNNLLVSESEINSIISNPGTVVGNYKYIRPDIKKRERSHSLSCSVVLGPAENLAYDFLEFTPNGYDIWRGGHQATIAALCYRYETPFKRSAEKIFSKLGSRLNICHSDVEVKNDLLCVKLWAGSEAALS
jgi:hypothetical protein